MPAMTSKQKIDQYPNNGKIDIDIMYIDIEEKYIIIFLIRTSAASQIQCKC